jgi:hypothetical protein
MAMGGLTEAETMPDLGGLGAWVRGSKLKMWKGFSGLNFGPLVVSYEGRTC